MSGGIYINGIQKGLVAPLADAAGNETVSEVVGNKTDTVAGTSLVALSKQALAAIPSSADVTAIKSVTDLIPDAGAMTSIAKEATLGAPVGASLSADIAAVKSTADAIETDTQDIQTQIGTAGAGLTAIPNVAQAAANSSGDSSGTFSYLDAGGEQTVVELTTTTRKQIYGISLDLSNITIDAAIIKVYLKPDGTNYREIQAKRLTFNASTDGDGVYIDLNMGITSDIKVTFTEGGDEGAARDIPYSLVYRTIE